MLTVYDGRFNYNHPQKRAFPVSDFHGLFRIGNEEDFNKIVELLKKYCGQQVDLVIDFEASLFGNIADDADDETIEHTNVAHMRLGKLSGEFARALKEKSNEFDVHVRLAYHVPEYIVHFRVSDMVRFVSDFYFTTSRNKLEAVTSQWPVPEHLVENNATIIAASLPGGFLIKAGVQPNLEGDAMVKVVEDGPTPKEVEGLIPDLAFRSRKGQLRGTIKNNWRHPDFKQDVTNPIVAEQLVMDHFHIKLSEAAFVISHIQCTEKNIYLGVVPSGPMAEVFKRIMAEDNGDFYFGARYLRRIDDDGNEKLHSIITWDLCYNPRKG